MIKGEISCSPPMWRKIRQAFQNGSPAATFNGQDVIVAQAISEVVCIVFVQFISISASGNNGILTGTSGISSGRSPAQLLEHI